jgi:hypothetical protein
MNLHPVTAHTAWCGRGHRCNLDEHRSHPQTWQTPYGGVSATLVQHVNARTAYLELRIRVAIPAGEANARHTAADIATGVDTAIRRVTRRYITREVSR